MNEKIYCLFLSFGYFKLESKFLRMHIATAKHVLQIYKNILTLTSFLCFATLNIICHVYQGQIKSTK
jgi:hypothetical protein